jgi:hypothetical protein
MTQDEIIEMAIKAGMSEEIAAFNIPIIEAFAKLVAAKALAQPTSAEYAMGYSEGFNDGCKTEPEQEPWCMKMNGCTAKCEDCPDKPPPTPQRTELKIKTTDPFESARVGDYNRGWNDCLFASGIVKQTQRTWVGLTDEQKYQICNSNYNRDIELVEMTEAKLKELNT